MSAVTSNGSRADVPTTSRDQRPSTRLYHSSFSSGLLADEFLSGDIRRRCRNSSHESFNADTFSVASQVVRSIRGSLQRDGSAQFGRTTEAVKYQQNLLCEFEVGIDEQDPRLLVGLMRRRSQGITCTSDGILNRPQAAEVEHQRLSSVEAEVMEARLSPRKMGRQ